MALNLMYSVGMENPHFNLKEIRGFFEEQIIPSTPVSLYLFFTGCFFYEGFMKHNHKFSAYPWTKKVGWYVRLPAEALVKGLFALQAAGAVCRDIRSVSSSLYANKIPESMYPSEQVKP